MLCQKHNEESNAGNGFKSDIASFDRKGAISKPGEHSKKPASSVHFDITFAHFAQNIVRNQVWKCCFLLKWQRLDRPTPTETGQTGCKTRSTQNGHTSPHHLTGMHKGFKKYSTYYNTVLKPLFRFVWGFVLRLKKIFIGLVTFSINHKCQSLIENRICFIFSLTIKSRARSLNRPIKKNPFLGEM